MKNQRMSATDMTDEEYDHWLQERLAANVNKTALGEHTRGAPKRTAEAGDRFEEQYPERDL
jgi:hypothetical protein